MLAKSSHIPRPQGSGACSFCYMWRHLVVRDHTLTSHQVVCIHCAYLIQQHWSPFQVQENKRIVQYANKITKASWSVFREVKIIIEYE